MSVSVEFSSVGGGRVAVNGAPPRKLTITGSAVIVTDNPSDGTCDIQIEGGAISPATTSLAGIVELATDGGTTSGTVVQATDSRLSNARTPTAHASTHESGGSDSIALDTLAAPSDTTTLNATTLKHGLLAKLSGTATQYMDGTGAWSTPAGTGGGGGGGGGGTTEVYGTQLESGNASTSVFTIAHGYGSTPGWFEVEAGSQDADSTFYVSADSTNITVTYEFPPPSGINNVKLIWRAGTPTSGGGTGTISSYSNAGLTGVGITLTAATGNLPFKSIEAGSNKVSVANDATNSAVSIDVNQANLSLSSIGGTATSGQLPSQLVYNNQSNTFQTGNAQFFQTGLLAIVSGGFSTAFAVPALAASRTLTLPNTTDTIPGLTTTNTFTNKTLDAGSNTITNLTNTNIATAAGIQYSKLSLTTSILNADISASANIAYSKLNLSNSIVDGDLSTFTSSKISITNKAQLNSNIIYSDQANTFGSFIQTIPTGNLALSSGTASTSLSVASMSSAQTLTLPNTTDTLVGRITTDTLQNKSISASNNTITDTSATTGDILKHNGTSFVRLPRGTGNQVLTTNSGATDIAWATPSGGGVSASAANTWSAVQTFDDGDLALENPLGTATATIKGGAQTGNVTFTFPATTSDTIDTINASQTLTNKSMSGTSNTFTSIPATALPATTVYTGQTNTFGTFDQVVPAGSLKLSNSSFKAALTTGTLTANTTLTLPIITDTLVARTTADTLTNKTISASSNTISNIADTNVSSSAAITWTKISKTGSSIDDLADVAISSLASGQVLASNGTAWANTSFNTENTGTATATGTGSAVTFNIAHNLGTTPYCAFVICSSLTNTFTYTYTSTNIVVVFTSAPANSASIIFQWKALA